LNGFAVSWAKWLYLSGDVSLLASVLLLAREAEPVPHSRWQSKTFTEEPFHAVIDCCWQNAGDMLCRLFIKIGLIVFSIMTSIITIVVRMYLV